jgi:chemotaxis protein MotB
VLCNTVKSLAVGLVLAGAVLPGCVSSTRYKQLEDEHVRAKDDLGSMQGQLSEVEDQLITSEEQQNQLRSKAERAAALEAENKELQAKIADLAKKGTITTPSGTTLFTDEGQYGWRAEGDVVFAPGSDKLTKDGERILASVATELKKSAEEITVRGHTDSDPVKKTADKWTRGNYELAANRALSVKEFLVAQGLDESRIAIAAYGPNKPIATGNSAADKAKNRRVEIMTRLAAGTN